MSSELTRARGATLGTALLFVALQVPAAAVQDPLFTDLHLMHPVNRDATFAPALGDLDGDGDLDVYEGNQKQDRVLLFSPDRGFEELPGAVPENPFVNAVELADLDGDGDLDAFVVDNGENALLFNGGAGVFTAIPGGIVPFDETSRDVAIGDVNQDGFPDAFVGQQSAPERCFLNDGSGLFPLITFILSSDLTFKVALTDVDGNGTLDAITANGSLFFEHNRLYANDGSGAFTEVPDTFTDLLSWTEGLDVGDADGDGNVDVLFGNNGFGQGGIDHLYLGDGAGGFTYSPAALPFFAHVTEEIAFADVDGDLDLDILMLTDNPNQPDRMYLNDGSGIYSDASAQWGSGFDISWGFAIGDIDLDGDPDIVVGNTYPNRLYMNDGTGTFTDVSTPLPVDRDITNDVALGDVDGDGDLDAFLVNDLEDPDRLWINNGAGLFEDRPQDLPDVPLSDSNGVLFEDFDGDGDADLLVVGDGKNRALRNDGSGVFGYSIGDTPSDLLDTVGVAAGDIDGDGDVDAAIANDDFWDQVYVNDGTGDLSNLFGALPQEVQTTRCMALGDVDLDGDLDLVRGFSNVVPDHLMLGDGTGVFSAGPAFDVADSTITYRVVLFDADTDGDLDVLFGKGFSDRFYRNEFPLPFTDDSANLPSVSAATRGLAVGDIDDDGDLDAFVAYNSFTQSNRIYVNDGTGLFTDGVALVAPQFDDSNGAALGDLDGDGALDVFIANVRQSRVLYQVERQVVWSGLPSVSKPLYLDLYGPASEAWVLAFALSAGKTQLPLRTLLLGPGATVVATGALDGDGRDQAVFPPVGAPVLIGLDVFWQAAVGNTPLFTNLERRAFTGL